MKLKKETLRDFMFQSAFKRHYEMKVTDNKALVYEICKAIAWYEEETK